MDSVNKLSDIHAENDLMILEIGQKISLFYSELRRVGDSIMMEDEKAGYNSSFINLAKAKKYNLDQWDIAIVKKFPLEEVTLEEKLIDVYRSNTKLITQSWEITENTAQIFGLMCNKATTNYRGRTHEAWFTRQIPTVHGPWKFYGLPGLIVKVNNKKKQFNLELTAVVKMPDNTPLVFDSIKIYQKFLLKIYLILKVVSIKIRFLLWKIIYLIN